MCRASANDLELGRFVRGSSNAVGIVWWKVRSKHSSTPTFSRSVLRGAEDFLGTLTTFYVAHQNMHGIADIV